MKKLLIAMLIAMFSVSVFAIIASEAEARAGGGGSRGSSIGNTGNHNYSAPTTNPGMNKPANNVNNAANPTNKPNGMGKWAGLLGAAAIGALVGLAAMAMFQNGMLSGILMYLLIGLVIFAIFMFIRSRRAATAGAGAQGMYPNPQYGQSQPQQPQVYNHNFAVAQAAVPTQDTPAIRDSFQMSEANLRNAFDHIKKSDPAFEPDVFLATMNELFVKIQELWRDKDMAYLEPLMAPAMYQVFAGQLKDMKEKQLINYMRSIKLLDKSVVEAWIEKNQQYITVHLNFSMIDYTMNAAGDVVDGSKDTPVTASELWTFVREDGNPKASWKLSAITQD